MPAIFYREASEPAAARCTNAAPLETHAQPARSLKSLTRAHQARDLIRSLHIGQGAADTH